MDKERWDYYAVVTNFKLDNATDKLSTNRENSEKNSFPRKKNYFKNDEPSSKVGPSTTRDIGVNVENNSLTVLYDSPDSECAAFKSTHFPR